MTTSVSTDAILALAGPAVRRILEGALSGRDVSVVDGVTLSEARGNDLHALVLTADALRREQAGDDVTYVVNRNINFTNVCVKTCRFCAFARGIRSEQGYWLPKEAIVERVLVAREHGATEVCIQAGLAPDATKDTYVDILRAVHEAAPEIHLHAFSPEEIQFAAQLGRVPVKALLEEMQDAGLGSLPGTSAEILDDELRKKIAPTRLKTADWIEVVESAHALGIPTTSTMMFGHLETAQHRAGHLDLLRSIQRASGGFTEFVPLSFVHAESPLFVKSDVAGVSPGPTGNDVARLYAIARLMLGRDIPNLQASWVKEGLRTTQRLLDGGANDVGGTLMNESISTQAGAQHGQLVTPAALRRLIRDAGRAPVQRNTRYDALRRYDDPASDPVEPLDGVTDPAAVFGSYDALAEDSRYTYEPRSARRLRVVDA